MKVVCFLLFLACVNGLIVDDKCMDVAKLDLCNKFFPSSTYTCYKTIVPFYNQVTLIFLFYFYNPSLITFIFWCNFIVNYLYKFIAYFIFIFLKLFKITLDICVTAEITDKRCFELRHVCSDYRFVAVYAPQYPKVHVLKNYKCFCTF